jgi:hypothetical protein
MKIPLQIRGIERKDGPRSMPSSMPKNISSPRKGKSL